VRKRRNFYSEHVEEMLTEPSNQFGTRSAAAVVSLALLEVANAIYELVDIEGRRG
jgi:hypothetical protein